MTIKPSVIVLSSYDVPDTQATAFTVAVDVLRMRVDQAIVNNYSGTPQLLTVYFLQDGDAVANIQKRLDILSIPANTAVPLFELIGMVLETGGIINAFADAADKLSLTINGTEFR